MKKILIVASMLWNVSAYAQTFPVNNLFVSGTSAFAGPVTFSTIPTSPSPAAGDSSSKLATTGFFTNPGPIGNVTPNSGSFTALTATGTVTGAGFTTLVDNILASPPVIGSSVPNLGYFTVLNSQTTVTAQPPVFAGNLNPVNLMAVTSDSTNVGSGFIEGAVANYAFGGSSTQGGRVAFYAQLQHTNPTNSVNPNRNYVANQGTVISINGDGGTDLTTGAKGAYFSFGGNTFVNSTAANLLEATGGEMDLDVQTGASVRYLLGWTLVNASAIHGSGLDAALEIGAATDPPYGPGVGWNNGIVFSDIHGLSPVNSNTTLMSGYFPTLGTQTINYGINLSNFNCTTACFASTNFSVNGAGQVSANLVSTSGSISAGTTGTMPLYGTTGNAINHPHMVVGSQGLTSGSATVTLSGSAVFTSAVSYQCTTTNLSNTNGTHIVQNSGTSITLGGTGNDTIGFMCAGN